MSTPKYDKTIIIDLDIRSADHAPYDKIIQRPAAERLKTIVGDLLKTAELSPSKNDERKRYHNAITVDGPRGAGKTTFMLSMISVLEEQHKDAPSFCFLGMIDPTLVETKEHVFLLIVSRIQKRVEDAYSCSKDSRHTDDFTQWKDSLRKLARGLSMLDHIGPDQLAKDHWEDEDYVLQEGLRNTAEGYDLEKHFNDYLEKSLALLKKKAFLVAFDDIDTNFRAGWPVLEILRKYLTSPHLILLISGDMTLYSHLVRKQQWENFGKDFLEQERAQKSPDDKFSRMVDSLEEQYLLKILRPEHRLEILSISDYQGMGYSFLVTLQAPPEKRSRPNLLAPRKLHLESSAPSEEGPPWELKAFVNGMLLDRMGIVPDGEKSVFFDLLLSEPVRTSLSVLYAHGKAGDKANQDSKRFFLDGLANAFLPTLNRVGIRHADIHIFSGSAALDYLSDLLVNQRMVDEGYKLFPDFRDREKNRLCMVIAPYLMENLRRNPGVMLEYFVKIGLLHDVATAYDRERGESVGGSESYLQHLQRDYLDFTTGGTREAPYQVARKAIPYLREVKGSKPFRRGTLRLMSENTVKKQKASRSLAAHYGMSSKEEVLESADRLVQGDPRFQYVKIMGEKDPPFNTVESLRNGIGPGLNERDLAMLGFSKTLPRASGDSTRYFSILNVLGCLSSLLACRSDKEVFELLLELGQFRSYPGLLPFPTGRVPDAPKQPLEEEGEGTGAMEDYYGILPMSIDGDRSSEPLKDLIADLSQIAQAFWKWRTEWGKVKDNVTLPVHVWGRIWTRFYYTLGSIDEDLPRDIPLGVYAHRTIVAFLHAVFLEEARYNNIVFDLSNPVASDTVFSRKLKNYQELFPAEKNTLHYFKFISACPLWGYYLDPEADLPGVVQRPRPVNFMGVEFDGFFHLFNSVLVSHEKKGGKTRYTRAPTVDRNQGALTDARRDAIVDEVMGSIKRQFIMELLLDPVLLSVDQITEKTKRNFIPYLDKLGALEKMKLQVSEAKKRSRISNKMLTRALRIVKGVKGTK